LRTSSEEEKRAGLSVLRADNPAAAGHALASPARRAADSGGDIAILADRISKKYRIGVAQASYNTMRDAMTNLLLGPFRRARRRRTEDAEGMDAGGETFWALKDVSFELKRGEVVGIVGGNGAGKSTLLKILSRITEPTSGTAEIRGSVGSLLEVGAGFHGELTGRENIYLNGAILGMPKVEITRKFDEIVAFSEVDRFIDTPVKHYSSGMYVRLAFAVAAHLEPDILIVDEVLAVGDAAFQKKCLGKMGGVAKAGRTVIFVSHNMSALVNLCEHGLLLERGRAVAYGGIDEVVSRYLSTPDRDQSGFADLTNHRDRAPGMQPIARAIGLRGEAGSYRTVAYTGEDLVFEIHYDSGDVTLDLVQLFVCSFGGRRIFTVGTHHSPEFSSVLRGKGVVECTLRGVQLAEGDYTVAVAFGRHAPRHDMDYVENALAFRVEFKDFFGTGEGPLPHQGDVVQRSEWNVPSEALVAR